MIKKKVEERVQDGIGVVDLMIGFPFRNLRDIYSDTRRGLKDVASDSLKMPAGYMFKDVPKEADSEMTPEEVIQKTFSDMDAEGIEIGLFGLSELSQLSKKLNPERVNFVVEIEPNKGMDEVRRVREAHKKWDIKAISVFSSGTFPQVAVNDPLMYIFYALCVELDIVCIANAGIAGPRYPSAVQNVAHFDRVCYDFPDLRLVMRHGAEPWEALAVKLMLKWPNLFYMPSAFAPKYYPEAIIKYANTRGADKIMYAGYYPSGLTLERIFTEMQDVPLKPEVFPKFLRENAMRVFKL